MPPGGAKRGGSGGDPFCEMLREQRWEYPTCDARWDVQYMGVWLSILQLAVIFVEIKAFSIPVCCDNLWCFTTPLIHNTNLAGKKKP